MEEYTPTTPSPFEIEPRGPDKAQKETKDKKKSLAETLLPPKKEQARRDLARSLDKLSLFEKPDQDEAPDKSEKLADKMIATKDELKSPEPADDKEAPANETAPAEERRATEEVAKSHLEDVRQSREVPDDTALDPVEDFLVKVSGGEEVDTAFNEVASELDASEDEAAEALAVATAEMPATEEVETVDVDGTEETPPEGAEGTAVGVNEGDEGEIFIGTSTEDDDQDSQEASAAAGSGGAGQSGRGGQGGGTNPPGGHNPPNNNPAAGQPGGYPAFNPSFYRPAAAVAPASQETVPLSVAAYYERRAQNRGLLVGGIVGYLIGRRRGRIKTQKRLLPIQKKLEKRVTSLERDIHYKEQALLLLAAQKSRLRDQNDRLKKEAERRDAKLPTKAETVRRPESKPEAPLVPPPRQASLLERTQAGRPESRLGLEKPKPAERLGQMVVLAESPAEARGYPRANSIRAAFRPEHVRLMHRRELLELSEKIVIEGASLRHIYETHLIGEKQLRHLVGEYLEGKDIRRDLRREMVEREIDFERDPLLRDRVRSGLAASDSLNQLLEKAGALPGEDPDDVRRAKLAAERLEAVANQSKRNRRVADTAMVTLIVVLAAAVVVLMLR